MAAHSSEPVVVTGSLLNHTHWGAIVKYSVILTALFLSATLCSAAGSTAWPYEATLSFGAERVTFFLWVPPEAKMVNGVFICHTHGLGAEMAEHWSIREVARHDGIAVVKFWSGEMKFFSAQKSHGVYLTAALQKLAEMSAHPEIENAPLATWGHSNGQNFSQGVANWKPDRMIAYVTFKGGVANDLRDPRNPDIVKVPHLAVTAESEFSSRPSIRTQLLQLRQQGEPVCHMIEPEGVHFCLYEETASLISQFIDRSFHMRVPTGSDPSGGPVTLRDIDQSAGWLGDPSSLAITPTAQFSGGASSGFWLFDEQFAREWKDYHTPRMATLSPATASVDLSGSPVTLRVSFGTTGFVPDSVVLLDNYTRIGALRTAGNNLVWTTASKGLHSVCARLYAKGEWIGTRRSILSVLDPAAVSQPYGVTPAQIPGIIEAENYDKGGEMVAYHDLNMYNYTSDYHGTFRVNEGVDILTIKAGGNALSWVEPGEWCRYTVNVKQKGIYKCLLTASKTGARKGIVRLSLNGSYVTESFSIKQSSGDQVFDTTVVDGIMLDTGVQILTLHVEHAEFGLDRMLFLRSTTEVSLPLRDITPGKRARTTEVRITTAPVSNEGLPSPFTLQGRTIDTGGMTRARNRAGLGLLPRLVPGAEK